MHESYDFEHMDAGLARAADLVRRATRVAALTGAGVSAESGVPTFRGAGGLWEGHRVEEVATPEAFARDPQLVWRFNNLRRDSMSSVEPNDGHRALAALEDRLGAGFTLVTQNIDGLHHRAGSRNVLEVHGRMSRVRCTACKYVADRPGEKLPPMPECPQCGKLLRPDVVWFGEMLPHAVWRAAQAAAEACQCFLVIGTSAVVFPAAGLIHAARRAGAAVIEFNLEETAASEAADVSLFGPSGKLLPELMRRLG
jgi:NAD-dependent deacetylase